MKKIKQLSILAVFAFLSIAAANAGDATTTSNSCYATGGYFDVYLKNNCSKEVEVKVRADGSTSVSKYKAGEKVKVAVKAGYEVSVDGKLVFKLSDSDSGKELNLCK